MVQTEENYAESTTNVSFLKHKTESLISFKNNSIFQRGKYQKLTIKVSTNIILLFRWVYFHLKCENCNCGNVLKGVII